MEDITNYKAFILQGVRLGEDELGKERTEGEAFETFVDSWGGEEGGAGVEKYDAHFHPAPSLLSF